MKWSQFILLMCFVIYIAWRVEMIAVHLAFPEKHGPLKIQIFPTTSSSHE